MLWGPKYTTTQCVLKECPIVPTLLALIHVQLDAVVRMVCELLFLLFLFFQFVCHSKHYWDCFDGVIVGDCGPPVVPANGDVRVFGTSVAVYICNDGYYLADRSYRVCLDNGAWSGSVPACNSKLITNSECMVII